MITIDCYRRRKWRPRLREKGTANGRESHHVGLRESVTMGSKWGLGIVSGLFPILPPSPALDPPHQCLDNKRRFNHRGGGTSECRLIPKKLMHNAASIGEQFKDAKEFG